MFFLILCEWVSQIPPNCCILIYNFPKMSNLYGGLGPGLHYSSSFFSFIVLFCLLDITCKTLSESVLCLHYSSSSQFCDGQIVDIFFVQTPVVEGYDLFYPYRNLTLPVPHYCDVSLPPIEVISVCVADRDMDKHWLHCWKCHF